MAQQVDVAVLALHAAGGGCVAAADELAVCGCVVEFRGVCVDAFNVQLFLLVIIVGLRCLGCDLDWWGRTIARVTFQGC